MMAQILARMEAQDKELAMLRSLQNKDKIDDYIRKNTPADAKQFRVLCYDHQNDDGTDTRYVVQYLKGVIKTEKINGQFVQIPLIHFKGITASGETIDEQVDHQLFNRRTAKSPTGVPLKETKPGYYYDHNWKPASTTMYVFDIVINEEILEVEIPYALVNAFF
jgi:hypothetical protein